MLTSRSANARLLSVFLALLVVVLAGCSGSKTATVPGLPELFPNHSATQIRDRITVPTDTLNSFQAKARVTVRAPERSGTFNAEIRQTRNDSLWMRMSRFGFEGARLLVTADSFFVHNRMENQFALGSVDAASQYLPGPVTVDQAFDNMLGLIAPEPNVGWKVENDSLRYYLTDPGGRRTYVVDARNWRVTRYARTDADGSVVEERLFGEFTTVNGVVVPTRVVFRRPPDTAMAVLSYDEIRLNPKSLSLDFRVPADVPRVSLQ